MVHEDYSSSCHQIYWTPLGFSAAFDTIDDLFFVELLLVLTL
jgi:hypothetical protein